MSQETTLNVWFDPISPSSAAAARHVRTQRRRLHELGARITWRSIQPAATPGGRAKTFDAHRLVQLAAAAGGQDTLVEELLAARHERGEDLADHDVLRTVAIRAGLDPVRAGRVLETDAYAGAVQYDRFLAQRLGIATAPAWEVGGEVFAAIDDAIDALAASDRAVAHA